MKHADSVNIFQGCEGLPKPQEPMLSKDSLRQLAVLQVALLPAIARASNPADPPIRVATLGLVHRHVKGLLSALPRDTSVQLVAIVEPNTALAAQYATQYHLRRQTFLHQP